MNDEQTIAYLRKELQHYKAIAGDLKDYAPLLKKVEEAKETLTVLNNCIAEQRKAYYIYILACENARKEMIAIKDTLSNFLHTQDTAEKASTDANNKTD